MNYYQLFFFINGLIIASINILVCNCQHNILLITVEDLGYNDVGFHGSHDINTPNIDALAYAGLILNNYYILPCASHSVSALLTEQFPLHSGVNHYELHNCGLIEPKTDILLSNVLKKQGYTNHLIGKWYFNSTNVKKTPIHRGYDSHFGYWNDRYFNHESNVKWRRNNVVIDYDGKNTIETFTNEAVAIINNHPSEKPLFLHISHPGIDPLQQYNTVEFSVNNGHSAINYFSRESHKVMVKRLDNSIGNLVEALQKNKLLNKTTILFTSVSTVGQKSEHPSIISGNYPFKGGKGSVWEGGIRGVAFIWNFDFKSIYVTQQRVVKELMHIVDWLPTIRNPHIASINDRIKQTDEEYGLTKNVFELMAQKKFEFITQRYSVNNKAALMGEESNRNIIIHNLQIDNFVEDNTAVTMNKWKLVIKNLPDRYYGFEKNDYLHADTIALYDAGSVLNSSANKALIDIGILLDLRMMIRLRGNATIECSQQYTSNQQCTDRHPCIFDISNDPCETTNLLSIYPDIAVKLRGIAASAREDYLDRIKILKLSWWDYIVLSVDYIMVDFFTVLLWLGVLVSVISTLYMQRNH